MGYTTEFTGEFTIDREIDPQLAEYINRFANVRHMKRDVEMTKVIYPNWQELCFRNRLGKDGEYLAIVSKEHGQEITPDIIDYNNPPDTQPGLWCHWFIGEDRQSIKWNEAEKFYYYAEWLQYIIDNFLVPNGYTVNGSVNYQGEDFEDQGTIIVKDNHVTTGMPWN